MSHREVAAELDEAPRCPTARQCPSCGGGVSEGGQRGQASAERFLGLLRAPPARQVTGGA